MRSAPTAAVRLLPLLLALFLAAPAAPGQDGQPRTLAVGSTAPDFSLPGVDAKTYTLTDFEKSPLLLVVFTCNHCPTAQYYEDRLIALANDYRAKGLALVAISPNDPKSVRLDELGYTDLGDTLEEMKVRATHKKFNFPYLYDGDAQTASRAYGPVATPHAFLFDKQRKLRYVGRIDDSELPDRVKTHDVRDAVEALLAGREPKAAQTRTFGCSVKWAGKSDAVKRFMDKLAAEPVELAPVDAAGLKALRGNKDSQKVRLVNFWATWCGPCVTEFPSLVEINRMYRHRAFEMVTVSANLPEEKAEVLAFLKKQQASGRNLIFASPDRYPLMEAFDKDWSGGVPLTLLIAPGGEVLYRKEGEIDPLELKRAVVKSLKEDRFKDNAE